MVSKALTLLRAVGRHPEGVGVSVLAREVDVPVSSVHRLLQDLVAAGFVDYDGRQRNYHLGIAVFELSNQFAQASEFAAVARPLMRRLTDVTGFNSLLATRHGADLVYLEHVHAPGVLQVRGEAGHRSALHATAMGKVLLASLDCDEVDALLDQMRFKPFTDKTTTDVECLRRELKAVREQGWATNEQEHEPGVVSLGVPVENGREVVAGLAVATPLVANRRPDLLASLELVRATAHEMGMRLPQGGGQ
jgi:DNA-binding IclR family transcriptional regulator